MQFNLHRIKHKKACPMLQIKIIHHQSSNNYNIHLITIIQIFRVLGNENMRFLVGSNQFGI